MARIFSITLETTGCEGYWSVITNYCWISFLNIGITLATFSLSGNIHVLKTCVTKRVRGLIMVGASLKNNLVEIPSNPLLFFVGSVSIVFTIVCSSISLNTNL